MCGIAGAINYYKYNLENVKKSLFHRGPDEQKIFKKDQVALIHTRLSVQDISLGQQPFCYQNYKIIFNGEIYNHLELRKSLKEFTFRTTSDTETLLYLYIKYKDKCLEMLDGMFAFSIWDTFSNKLFLSRDRSGKKPLYLYKDHDSIFFASELNALKTAIPTLTIDEDAIYTYLRNGFFYGKYTPYNNIKEIEAGCFYEIDIKSLEIKKHRYFDIKEYYDTTLDISFSDALISVDNALHKSVKDRLLSSDLEVGAFLSGGIDSSLIVAIASQYQKNIKTFTVKFDGAYDESVLAELTAKKYGTEHHTISLSMNVKEDIEEILGNYGMPFMDSSAIPSFYVSKEAKEHVTVVLNGDGADELFGGYRRYIPLANNLISIASYFAPLLRVLPLPKNKKSLYSHFYRLLSMSGKDGLDFYNSATTDIFEDIYKFENNKIFEEMNVMINSVRLNPMSKQLYLDFKMILLSDLLVKMDIATMSHSLEGRSPFLSRYMLELAPSLPNRYKVQGRHTKYLLRELAKQYLPKELITQPKRGFEVPLMKWVDNDLKENIFDALSSESYSSKFIDRGFITDLLNKKSSIPPEKRAKLLWTMYSLEVWKKNQ